MAANSSGAGSMSSLLNIFIFGTIEDQLQEIVLSLKYQKQTTRLRPFFAMEAMQQNFSLSLKKFFFLFVYFKLINSFDFGEKLKIILDSLGGRQGRRAIF